MNSMPTQPYPHYTAQIVNCWHIVFYQLLCDWQSVAADFANRFHGVENKFVPLDFASYIFYGFVEHESKFPNK